MRVIKLKAGTVLHRGGGLTKKGVSLEKGTSNALGIQTYKKNKVWKIEDFESEKEVAKKEGDKDIDELSAILNSLDSKDVRTPLMTPTETPSAVKAFWSGVASGRKNREGNTPKYQTPSPNSSSVSSLPTGMSPTVQMMNRTPTDTRNTRVTRQSANARILFPHPQGTSLSLQDLEQLQRL